MQARPFPCSLIVLGGLALLAVPVSAVSIDWVFVGDPGNAADTPSANCNAADCGSVPYEYFISRYEVTNAQYAEFLNAKAPADPLELYNTNMGSNVVGGITRNGDPGSFTYDVKPGFETKPVNFVSFHDALRFANWLNNGQGSADTETGAYTITASGIANNTISRNPGASIFLPSENEWYKAAYWNPGTQSFLDFPASSNDPTVCAAPGAMPNTANCGSVVGSVTEAGAYPGSASPNGTLDQGGNVFEWNEQIVSLAGLPLRGLRGGSFENSAALLGVSFADFSIASTESGAFGFRVASLVPEPGTALLLVTGLAGLAARQARRARNV